MEDDWGLGCSMHRVCVWEGLSILTFWEHLGRDESRLKWALMRPRTHLRSCAIPQEHPWVPSASVHPVLGTHTRQLPAERCSTWERTCRRNLSLSWPSCQNSLSCLHRSPVWLHLPPLASQVVVFWSVHSHMVHVTHSSQNMLREGLHSAPGCLAML